MSPSLVYGRSCHQFFALFTLLGAALTISQQTPGGRPGISQCKGHACFQKKLWGSGGDIIQSEDGHRFVYNNKLGGTWVDIPFNDTARPQGDQPSLSERWDYSHNRILGVNLGGWLVLEPFITPSLFEPYANSPNPVVDEWTLCTALGAKMASTLERHYSTFITEQDFAQIAAAGLNWVRIPIGWWMIETWAHEPLLEGVSFKYLQKAIIWARKYGIRINLDLHAVPGSQNGWNHSGRFGTVGFLHGVMGIANAQRTLNYVRTLAEFISQPQYKNVVPMFTVLNEAALPVIGSGPLRSWYYRVYKLLRMIGGVGEGHGPFMIIHDGFDGPQAGRRGWDGYLKGADRLGLDTHSYLCFGPQNIDSMGYNSMKPCLKSAALTNQTMAGFGLSITGEFSLAINDCGQYINNVGSGNRFDGTFPTAKNPDKQFKKLGTCDHWVDHRQWSDATKTAFADLAQTQQDSMRNTFFWTWKTGKSVHQDHPVNPMWSYQNGLINGYIRPDARTSSGRCEDVVSAQGGKVEFSPWSGKLASWQTGGNGAGVISPSQIESYGHFPPDRIAGGPDGTSYASKDLPRYVQDGKIVILKPTIPEGLDPKIIGDGWTQDQDHSKWWIPKAGCTYPDPWGGVGIQVPSHACGKS